MYALLESEKKENPNTLQPKMTSQVEMHRETIRSIHFKSQDGIIWVQSRTVVNLEKPTENT